MTLIERINAFCERKEISGNRFGTLATGCNKTVGRMRQGYVPSAAKCADLERFMEAHEDVDLKPRRGHVVTLQTPPVQELRFQRDAKEGSDLLLTKLWAEHRPILRCLENQGLKVVKPFVGGLYA